MRTLALVTVVALAAIGIAFAVLPFAAPEPDLVPVSGLFYGNSADCSAPVVSAFRTERVGGWFGYAPLTSTPLDAPQRFPTCRSEGQRRLQYGGMFILAAVVIAVALWRERSEEADPPPSLAIP